MATVSINVFDGNVERFIKVRPRWSGDNLCVHRKIVKRADINDLGQLPIKNEEPEYVNWSPWTISHIKTGMAGAIFNNLDDALKVAKMADHLPWPATKDEIHNDKDLVDLFKDAVKNHKGLTK